MARFRAQRGIPARLLALCRGPRPRTGAGNTADRKSSVGISAINPVGHYAVQITFDDGHDSGLYSWRYLRDLAEHQDQYWQRYLQQLSAEGSHVTEIQVLHFEP